MKAYIEVNEDMSIIKIYEDNGHTIDLFEVSEIAVKLPGKHIAPAGEASREG
jgi:hypothetical protein